MTRRVKKLLEKIGKNDLSECTVLIWFFAKRIGALSPVEKKKNVFVKPRSGSKNRKLWPFVYTYGPEKNYGHFIRINQQLQIRIFFCTLYVGGVLLAENHRTSRAGW